MATQDSEPVALTVGHSTRPSPSSLPCWRLTRWPGSLMCVLCCALVTAGKDFDAISLKRVERERPSGQRRLGVRQAL